MRTLEREGVVIRDSLSFVQIRDQHGTLRQVHVYGQIECAEDVVVQVDKWLDVQGSRVRGVDYGYHAYTPRDPDVIQVIRYDMAHGPLHRHVFDAEGREIAVQPMELADLPNLDQVIVEAVELVRRRR